MANKKEGLSQTPISSRNILTELHPSGKGYTTLPLEELMFLPTVHRFVDSKLNFKVRLNI